MSWASRSFASSLSFFAAAAGSLVNWKVNEFPSWRTIWICILELPSGLIRWTVEKIMEDGKVAQLDAGSLTEKYRKLP